MLTTQPRTKSVSLSNGNRYSYQWPWDGRTLLRGTAEAALSFDTETELIDGHTIPRMALAIASVGRHQCFLHPQQLASFILRHVNEHWVVHNAAFDYWVVHQHLSQAETQEAKRALQAWVKLVDDGRLHDTMLLDMLLRLAKGVGYEAAYTDTDISPRNLGELAKEYLHLKVDKEDPYRLRYGELIGVEWESVQEEGFWSYAIKDAIVTHLLWRKLHHQGRALLDDARRRHPRDIAPAADKPWGVLTESLQVRAAIALAAIERRGFRVDPVRAAEHEALLRADMVALSDRLKASYPQVLVLPRGCFDGQLDLFSGTVVEPLTTPKTGSPKLKKKVLQQILADEAARLGLEPILAKGKTGGVSVSAKDWAPLAKASDFIGIFADLAKISKMLSFYVLFHDTTVLRGRYSLLKRTGRCSCSRPNITQMPRDKDLRSLFRAREGMKLVTIDYSFIELRTLAHVCECRYGKSALADVIRARLDPHENTAAMLGGLSLEAFQALKTSDPTRYKAERQAAKAVGFGVPGGLGPVKLAAYAHANYGVEMSIEDAAIFRHKLITDVYPELTKYLADLIFTNIAYNLKVKESEVLDAFDILEKVEEDPEALPRMSRSVAKVLRGTPVKADGTPYKEQFVTRIWAGVAHLARSTKAIPAKARKAIDEKEGSLYLEQVLCCGPALTRTGRIRGHATYTQARNSPFQGLAADGAKLALWLLVREGFGVVGFVHDEVLVEVPASRAEEEAERVEQLLIEGMERVLEGKVPVACEKHIADCWQK